MRCSREEEESFVVCEVVCERFGGLEDLAHCGRYFAMAYYEALWLAYLCLV